MSVNISEIFGENVFSMSVMRERLPKKAYAEVVDVMEHGGHIRGWQLSQTQMTQVADALCRLADPEAFRARYHTAPDASVLLFAVGDGNHSLATAKACYEEQKKALEARL